MLTSGKDLFLSIGEAPGLKEANTSTIMSIKVSQAVSASSTSIRKTQSTETPSVLFPPAANIISAFLTKSKLAW